MIFEITVVLSLLLISVSIILASKEIGEAIINPKGSISKNMFGQIKKAVVVKKKSDIDELLGE